MTESVALSHSRTGQGPQQQQRRDEAAKAAGAVLCVEGAGTARWNGYYKQDGAPASLPL